MIKSYFTCRNGKAYLKYTKQEIINMIDINQPNTWKAFLKDMDYPWLSTIYKASLYHHKPFQAYINICNLAAYKQFGFEDSEEA